MLILYFVCCMCLLPTSTMINVPLSIDVSPPLIVFDNSDSARSPITNGHGWHGTWPHHIARVTITAGRRLICGNMWICIWRCDQCVDQDGIDDQLTATKKCIKILSMQLIDTLECQIWWTPTTVDSMLCDMAIGTGWQWPVARLTASTKYWKPVSENKFVFIHWFDGIFFIFW